jgi:hypothetical protein
MGNPGTISTNNMESTAAEVSAVGGARIGWVNASWPFARLTASANHLKLTGLIGTYEFLPKDVVSLERYGSIPLFYSGIRIVHNRRDYPSKIIFWCFNRPETLIDRVRSVGFSPIAPASSEAVRRGFPIRWTVILLFLLLWDGPFLFYRPSPHTVPGLLILAELSLTFLLCWGVRTSAQLQRLVLRQGHTVTEIKSLLLLIQMVTGILTLVFAVLLVSGNFPK